MNSITIVANAGRSGSTYLANLLRTSAGAHVYVAHEDIPVQISRPRYYNRAYDAERKQKIIRDPELKLYFDAWQEIAEERVIIETGWTAYHLLPILKEIFDKHLKIIILHRDPWSVALSRANMGNYHPETFYDDAHEVSPSDTHTIAPEFSGLWPSMNHVEKCLYWWFVCYREIIEFVEANSDVPTFFLSAKELFASETQRAALCQFLGLPDACLQKNLDETKNPVGRFMRETFPITDEWRQLLRHESISDFARCHFGYETNFGELKGKAANYALPRGPLPWLRHRTRYWKRKSEMKRFVLNLVEQRTNAAFGVGA